MLMARRQSSEENRCGQGTNSYWSELPTSEKIVLEFDPMSRTVPSTITRTTASMIAYSATSWPRSSDQNWKNFFTHSSL